MIPVPYILLYSYLRSIYYFRMRINLTKVPFVSEAEALILLCYWSLESDLFACKARQERSIPLAGSLGFSLRAASILVYRQPRFSELI